MRRTAVLACLLGLTLAALAPAASAHPTGMVTEPTMVQVVNGERVELAMHGDRIPRGSDFELRTRARTAPRLSAASLAGSWCGTARSTDDTANASHTGSRVKVVYAYATGEPNNFDLYKDMIQTDIATIADWVAASSGGQKTIRFDTGTSCGPEYVDIAAVQLPRTLGTYNASPSRSGMVAADVKLALTGMTGTRNTLIYADRLYAGDGVLGTAQMPMDDQPGGLNDANSGGATAMVWGDGGGSFVYDRLTTVLHEVSHTLGAVQDSAPSSTLAGHCREMEDVMCYPDGGSRGAPGDMIGVCPATSPVAPYECGMNDYFSPAPAAGSYLATHWNLYDSAFMCAVSSCVMPKGAAPVPPPPPAPEPVSPEPGPSVPVPDPGQAVGEEAAAWLDGFMVTGTAALRKLGLRRLAQGRSLSIAGRPPGGHAVQVDLMMGASAIAGGPLGATGKALLKVPRVHRRILAKRTKVRFTLQGVIRSAAGGGPPTVKRVTVTLKAPAKKTKRRR